MKAVSGGSVRIVLLTGHLSHAAGGLSVSVPGMARSLGRLPDTCIHIVGVRDRRAPNAGATRSENEHSHSEYGPRKFHWAPGIARTLDSINPDLIDVQGIRMHQSLVNLRRHRRTGRPYVVTPRGMLDPWTLQRSAWKKQAVGRLFENEHLRRAACLRALTAAEAETFRAHGLTNPIAVVPNGVEIDMAGPLATRAGGARVLLFLGRLDPKKGVEELLQAWAMVQARPIGAGWRLQVTGWGEAAYVSHLQRLADELSLGATVSFTGPLFGADKAMAFRNASGFILPSFSEGLPMSVLEAWSRCLPVLMTAECNVAEGFAVGAALRITPEPRALAHSLVEFLAMSVLSAVRWARRAAVLSRNASPGRAWRPKCMPCTSGFSARAHGRPSWPSTETLASTPKRVRSRSAADELDIGANRRAPNWSGRELLGRVFWEFVRVPLFAWTPRPFWAWRRGLLRVFGAKVGRDVRICPSVEIAVPWTLQVDDEASVGDGAILYGLGAIVIGAQATVSQHAHLCAGTHDYRNRDLPLVKSSITIGPGAWICADAFVGPDVTIGRFAILGARGVAVADVPPWTIAAGNPARPLRPRPRFAPRSTA